MLCNGQDEIEKGLPPTPDTLHLGCSSYHLHTSHRFLSTWGTVMLEKVRKKKKKKKKRGPGKLHHLVEEDAAALCSSYHQIASNLP